jgi:hypothetical protein
MRSEADLNSLFQRIRWSEYTGPAGEGHIVQATHMGMIEVNGQKIRCYRLRDGSHIFDSDDVMKFLLSSKSSNSPVFDDKYGL